MSIGQVVQLNWDFGNTGHKIFELSWNLIKAATSDNVQVAAILACQMFGNTLAICEDTSQKIGVVLHSTPSPAKVPFLDAVVGFFSDDTAGQLGSNAAGVRFLALAAALITTMDLFEASKSVEAMVRKYAYDLTVVPSRRRIQDLLAVLEPRSHQSGFAELVAGWQTLLYKELLPRIIANTDNGPSSSQKIIFTLLKTAPSPDLVEQLVDTFRQIARVGEEDVVGASIMAGEAAPWIIAFTKWCLGPIPSVIWQDKDCIINSPQSQVNVKIVTSDGHLGKGVKIRISRSVGQPRELVSGPSHTKWRGLVSVPIYGKWLLQEFEFADEYPRRILCDALSYALPQAMKFLNFSEFSAIGQRKRPWGRPLPIAQSQARSILNPLPGTRRIREVYAQLFSLVELPKLIPPTENRRVEDLPAIRDYLDSLQETCVCHDCRGPMVEEQPSDWTICLKSNFWHHLSFVVADILVLSLFDPL
ncbi:hypothetical protein F5Y15DRAFT_214345 [Xylariaceae sp. FL0016]|nr:hypothetical protein F5Y15DRAFT_214345 [Xylariaceae sp. FL0016]